MKKIILLLTAVVCALGLVSCNIVKASGNITSEIVRVGAFDGIDVSNGIRVYLDASTPDNGRIEVEADDNLHKYIHVYVDDRELVVELADDIIVRNGTIKVYVNNDAITSLEGSGGSKIECSGVLSERELDIDLSGGSSFNGRVNVDEMDVELSGGSRADIEGMCGNFDLDSSGGSVTEGYDLHVDNSALEISGGSRVEQTIIGTLRVNASGGSTVRYKGDPQIIYIDVSGGSTVRKAD